MHEVQPLPPLPVEEGLEMLPPAEETGRARLETGEALIMGGEEIPGPAHDEAEEPEELEEAEEVETVTTAGRARRPPPRGPAEFEELEAVEEEPEAKSPAPSPAASEAERSAEIESLIRAGAIKAWTIEDLTRMVEEGKSAIVMENGVFRIKEEVYQSGEKARETRPEASLRELAAEVVGHEEKEAGEGTTIETPPPDEPGTGGIGDLLRDEDTLDLSKVVSGERGACDRRRAFPSTGKRATLFG